MGIIVSYICINSSHLSPSSIPSCNAVAFRSSWLHKVILIFRYCRIRITFSRSERQIHHSSLERAHYSVIPGNETPSHAIEPRSYFFFAEVMAHTHLTTIQSEKLVCRQSYDATTKYRRHFL